MGIIVHQSHIYFAACRNPPMCAAHVHATCTHATESQAHAAHGPPCRVLVPSKHLHSLHICTANILESVHINLHLQLTLVSCSRTRHLRLTHARSMVWHAQVHMCDSEHQSERVLLHIFMHMRMSKIVHHLSTLSLSQSICVCCWHAHACDMHTCCRALSPCIAHGQPCSMLEPPTHS